MNFKRTGMVIMTMSASLGLGASTLKAPDFKVTRSAGEVRATAPAAHHFNLQAPKELRAGGTKIQPSKESTEHELRFATSEKGELVLRAYLCDNAKTFCEQHVVKISADGTQAQLAPTDLPGHAGAPSAADAHGFIVNDAPTAIARAKKENKPLLVDFFGIWCPPCNQLDEHVFSSPEFAKEKSRFVLLKLDADSEASWELKTKYKVGGYPTIVIATPEGEEITRIVGFRPKADFVAEMKHAWDNRASSLDVLAKRAKSGDREAALKLAGAHNERKEYDAAWALVEKVAPDSEEGFEARIGAIESLKNKDAAAYDKRTGELASVYEKAIATFPKLPESVEWGTSLAGLHEKAKREGERKAALKGAAERAEQLAATPTLLTGRDYRPADLWSMAADAREELGDAAASKKDWTEAVREYRKLLSAADERGYNLELAYALWKTGDSAGAEAIYKRLETKFPAEFTFWYAHARMKVREKKQADARPLAEKALEHAYGDNRIRSAQLLAEILIATDHKEDARKLVTEEVARVKLPEDPNNRTHFYVKSLQAVLEKAPAQH